MKMNEYQQRAAETAIYPGQGKGEMDAVQYCVLGLAGEAGEVANKLQKVLRDHDGILTPELRDALSKELGGVLWYLAMAAGELHFTLDHIATENLKELVSRKERGTLQGSGDDR